jgi:Ran GTPase-activating protein (RanGAP) involved in mRNA processing and transport
MGAILSVNLLKNSIPMEQAKALATILKDHPTLKSLCGNSGDETELDMSGQSVGAEGAAMLAPEIADNGALTSLNLANNNIGQLVLPNPLPDGWEVHLGGNHYKHKDGSEWGGVDTVPGAKPLGSIAIASAIPDMGALSSLNLAENSLGELVLPAGWKKTAYKQEWIHSDGTKVTDNPGIPEGIVAIATAIPDMRALLSLDISNNGLRVEGTKLLANALESNQTMTSLNFSSNNMTYDGKNHGDMSGVAVAALADAIPGMGAMTSLDLSSNKIGSEGAVHVAEAIKVRKCVVVVVLVPYSC